MYLFSNAGTILASKDAPALTANAWNEVLFTTPVAVTTATTYVVAVYCPTGAGNWAYNAAAWSGITTGNLQALANGVDGLVGVYSGGRDTFPTTTDGGTTYGISPLFSTGGLVPNWPVALKSIPPGGTAAQVLAKVTGTDWDVAFTTPASGGVTSHAALTGLGADHHTQYYNQTRGDARYSVTGHNHSGVYDPAGTAASAVSTHAGTAGHEVLASTTPAALGTAAVGTGTTTARADHVHQMPTAAQVGATTQAYVDARVPKVTVASSAPGSPTTGDVWIDTT